MEKIILKIGGKKVVVPYNLIGVEHEPYPSPTLFPL